MVRLPSDLEALSCQGVLSKKIYRLFKEQLYLSKDLSCIYIEVRNCVFTKESCRVITTGYALRGRYFCGENFTRKSDFCRKWDLWSICLEINFAFYWKICEILSFLIFHSLRFTGFFRTRKFTVIPTTVFGA